MTPTDATTEQLAVTGETLEQFRERERVWSQWAWFAGPHEDEFSWGRYPTRQSAINEGNGFCTTEGQPFYIVEARGYASESDEEGMIQFAETRNLERVNCVDNELSRQPCLADEGRERALLVDLSAMRAANDALSAALEWYGEQARLCRLIHAEGDAGRNALAADGGKKAQAALAHSDEVSK